MPIFLTTQDGKIITTESGEGIIISNEVENGTIQQFDFSVDLLRAIIWEYNEAANIQSLLNFKDAWYKTNQQDFWLGWFLQVFNVATADEFGLKIWSIILGIPLFVNIPPISGEDIFGFDNQTGFNFDNGIFGSDFGTSYELPLETKRIAIQLRYFQLTSSGTLPETNRMLKYVFGDMGLAYLVDNGDMTQTYIFDFALPFNLQYLFNNYDILPRPAGVNSSYVDNTLKYFGFSVDNLNFDDGGFQN